jgi:isochorismate synthase
VTPGEERGLVARARRLGASFDLLAAYDPPGGVLFERGGRGVAGSPPAVAVEVAFGLFDGHAPGRVASSVAAQLRQIGVDRDDAPPVAVGVLPFDGPAVELSVPRRAVLRTTSEATWRIDTHAGDEAARATSPPGRMRPGAPREEFSPVQLTPLPPPEAYAEMVSQAVSAIHAGELRKVVLARTIEVCAGRPFDAGKLARRLRAVDPDAYTFAVPTGGAGVLVGASPELLVARRGPEVRSNPLAGSAPRSGDPDEDRANAAALAASAKNREEHDVVVRAIADTLRPYCRELRWDGEPVLLETANVWHLSTRFSGTLREPPPSVMELVAALHPTPAVCGAPTDAARGVIASLEPFDRGTYSGPVGWVDARGDGEWAIALRCAELRGHLATLFAGAGIVAASEPESEVEETERKFRAFLDALRWG